MFIPGYSLLWKFTAEPLPPSVLLCPKEARGGAKMCAGHGSRPNMWAAPSLQPLVGMWGGYTRACDRHTFRREDGPACPAMVSGPGF